MTKNLGRDFVYGHESRKPETEGRPRWRVFGISAGAFVPLVAMSVAFLMGRYFLGS